MKNLYILFVLIAFLRLPTSAQDTLAAWTFPTGTAADSIANIANAANLAAWITTEGGTSAIDFTKNGFTNKAAQATGWDNGANTKAWVVNFSSAGYQNLTISSRQQSGGNNPGPLYYQLQFWVSPGPGWIDVPAGSITTANDWTTAFVSGLALPAMIDNHIQTVSLRWLQTSDTSSGGNNVVASGTNKIDEIYITGTPINIGIPQQTPATSGLISFPGGFSLKGFSNLSHVSVFDMSGRQVYEGRESRISGLKKGVYVVVIDQETEMQYRHRVVVQ